MAGIKLGTNDDLGNNGSLEMSECQLCNHYTDDKCCSTSHYIKASDAQRNLYKMQKRVCFTFNRLTYEQCFTFMSWN